MGDEYVKVDIFNEEDNIDIDFRPSRALTSNPETPAHEQSWGFSKEDTTALSPEDMAEWSSETLGIPLELHGLIFQIMNALIPVKEELELYFIWENTPDGQTPVKPIPVLSNYPEVEKAVNELLEDGNKFSWR